MSRIPLEFLLGNGSPFQVEHPDADPFFLVFDRRIHLDTLEYSVQLDMYRKEEGHNATHEPAISLELPCEDEEAVRDWVQLRLGSDKSYPEQFKLRALRKLWAVSPAPLKEGTDLFPAMRRDTVLRE